MNTQNTTTWINSTTPPQSQKRVLVVAENENGKRYRTIAVFLPKGACCDDYYEDPPENWYNEETEHYEFQEDCWAESAWNAEEWTSIDRVTHWAELPKLPQDAATPDLSAVEVHSKETMDEVRAALSDIVRPLGDETETSGNPCCSPSPAQGRRLAAALAKLNPPQ